MKSLEDLLRMLEGEREAAKVKRCDGCGKVHGQITNLVPDDSVVIDKIEVWDEDEGVGISMFLLTSPTVAADLLK